MKPAPTKVEREREERKREESPIASMDWWSQELQRRKQTREVIHLHVKEYRLVARQVRANQDRATRLLWSAGTLPVPIHKFINIWENFEIHREEWRQGMDWLRKNYPAYLMMYFYATVSNVGKLPRLKEEDTAIALEEFELECRLMARRIKEKAEGYLEKINKEKAVSDQCLEQLRVQQFHNFKYEKDRVWTTYAQSKLLTVIRETGALLNATK